ncbi:MAG: hypothetical protein FD165_1596 [Gammaproteobacteria bacterium]|nr:MAG: hypothetical protein FD165_1596 [Gammaproteobacteria bacterium]TND05507.1 MAG: hypothetical protein FD120_1115 [Gammaproteobacteria bacterium]
MGDPEAPTFDFDEWQRLAQTDPAAFEDWRASVIRQFIEQAPPDRRRRLEGLQWRIDMERRKYRDPLVSSQRLYGLMLDSYVGEGGLLAAVGQLTASGTATTGRAASPAKILPFRNLAATD